MAEPAELILVVDDDAVNRDLMTRRLARKGYQVEAVAGGPAALAFLADRPVALVLLDWQMPEMSGIDVLKAIRDRPTASRTAVLMVTAKNDTADVVMALECGADDYISKPVDFPVAFARIQTQLSRKRAEDRLRESEERYALAAQGANDGLWDWRIDANQIYFSQRWKEIVGHSDDEIGCVPDEWFNRVHPDDLAGQTEHFKSEHRIRHKNGTFRWVLARALAVRSADGVVTRVAGSHADITDGKVVDPLTGLPNRLLLVDRLDRLIRRRLKRGGGDFAVLLVDLDGFKIVNDSLGHRFGDELLQDVARRLEASLRATDTVTRASGHGPEPSASVEHTLARVGGDEFIVLLNDLRDVADASLVAERVHSVLAEPFLLAGGDVFVAASIGIAVSATGYTTTDEVLRDAGAAMHRAKALGRGRSEMFDAAIGAQAAVRLRLDSEVRLALMRHEFLPYYQPLIDLRSGRLIGFEALIRWNHPTRGILPPAEFLSLVEENGLILAIGRQFFADVCLQHRRWLDAHPRALELSINVNFTSGQLLEAGLTGRLLETLGQAGLAPGHVVVEITESTAIRDLATTIDVLRTLRDAGVRVVLDDFGTGYSSLACLHQLPISGLKLDRSFVATLTSQDSLVRAVLTLAENLGLTVTGEGIETVAQWERLRALDCDFGQGYLFARPLTAAAAVALIDRDQVFAPEAQPFAS